VTALIVGPSSTLPILIAPAHDRCDPLLSRPGPVLPLSRPLLTPFAPTFAREPANALTEADFDAVLADYGEVLDISRKDLEVLYLELAKRAAEKRVNAGALL
jgi:hypothetical protein